MSSESVIPCTASSSWGIWVLSFKTCAPLTISQV
jgi:hypothetical protein